MTRYFIGIGSNEKAHENCQKMIAALRQQFGDIQISQIIQTKSFGIEAPDYLNAVACIETEMDHATLNKWCKWQEKRLGRDRQQILCHADLDILLAVEEHEPVNTHSVQETYFHPLIAELQS